MIENNLDKGGVQMREFCLQEIALHNKPNDCWLIIDRKVYDVSEFVGQHPRGTLIYVSAGQDCTQLFLSYHPIYVRKLLDQYYIGNVQQDEQLLTFQNKENGSKFYDALKQRADKYFKSNKVKYYFAIILGFLFAQVGVSIMHDANHGAYSKNKFVQFLGSISCDFCGVSSFMWRQQHVVGHHQHTNVHKHDPDIHHDLVFRATPQQSQMKHHRLQHIYCILLYGLLAVKCIWFDDFAQCISGKLSTIKIQQMTIFEGVVFWSGKLFFFTWFVMLPVIWSSHSITTLVLLQFLAHATTGYVLSFMFQVAHMVGEVDFFEIDDKQQISCGWAESQLLSTADFAPGSIFWTHISGGLNHQVVHHLFPGVCHAHFAALSIIVADTAKEFGLKYNAYPTFWAALRAHFKHMQEMGTPINIPSLHTMG